MTPWVLRFLIANIVMFFVQQTAPEFTRALVFEPRQVLTEPWTMVTYMFLHGGLGHLFWNMLGLYFFGPRVEERMGSEHFVVLYFLSGIAGALLSFVFSPTAGVVGASAALYGVMLAFARFWPRDRIYIWGIVPVEARWLVVGFTVMNLFGGFGGGGGNTAHFAHLGGFVGAFLYLQFISRNAAGAQFRRKVTAAPPPAAMADWGKVDRTRVHAVNRDEVDRILDKISATGIASLTPQERVFLSNFVPMDDRKPT
ncbi:MAG: Peptidase rhomboid domain protein [Gemmatimonadetes bacterium]|nr:Peptidase rhomboid domain protein [Gemmatimonadota bacterium]